MFNLAEIKVLLRQLSDDVAATQKLIDSTNVDSAEHVTLENRLIVLVSIKRKLALKLDRELERVKEQTKQAQTSVLIVDDSETIREVLRCYFDELGFKDITLAQDGMEAWRNMRLQHEKDEPFGLIVSDWNMPKMSGIELLEHIRNDENFGSTPVYLITSNRDKESIVSAIQKGVNGYLVKPVNYNHIQDKFAKYLP